MLVLVNGMYRSGSTAAYNAARLILETTKHGRATGGVGGNSIQHFVNNLAFHDWIVAKTHEQVVEHRTVKMVFTYRHPFDMTASRMMRHDIQHEDTEKALNEIRKNVDMYWRTRDKSNCLMVRYEDWYPFSEPFIEHLARFMNVYVNPEQMKEILQAMDVRSMKQVSDSIARADADPITQLRGEHISERLGQPGAGTEIVSQAIRDAIASEFGRYMKAEGYA